MFLPRLRAQGERGAATFLIVLTIVIVIFAGAFAVDMSSTANRGQDLQNAADSAALAGVQAFRASMATRETQANPEPVVIEADKQAARDAVDSMLLANGISGVSPLVTFPDDVTSAEVSVKLVDPTGGGRLLSGFTGGGGGIERDATARFEPCKSDCVNPVSIPAPFRDINTFGDGDGYKPVAVGDRMFSINHNSGRQSNGSTRGNRQITCVDRFHNAQCWDTPGRQMYPGLSIGNWVPDATPEMPHAAVVNEMIYWTSSTQDGTYLFCFNAAGSRDADGVGNFIDTPCAVPYKLNDRARGSLNDVVGGRVQHRGGGTFAYQGLVYVFTDDHRIHCIEPGLPLTPCEDYGAAGMQTRLGMLNFPANSPADGNDGSSIDRIIDTKAGKVYATLHVTNTAPTHTAVQTSPQSITNPTCAAPLTDPMGDEVVIRNVDTGTFLASSSPRSGGLRMLQDYHITARWTVLDGDDDNDLDGDLGTVFLRNHGSNRHVATYYGLAWAHTERAGSRTPFDLKAERWKLTPLTNDQFEIERAFHWNGFPVGSGDVERLVTFRGDVAEARESWNGSNSDEWEFWPYECVLPNYVPPSQPDPTVLPYETGTYLHCWDLTVPGVCTGFSPVRIHEDPDSFSGRLFFHRTPRTPGMWNEVIDGVCSTGFSERWRWMNMHDQTQLRCFDSVSGSEEGLMAASLGPMKAALEDTNTGSNGWGTWGDPHWNQHSNRVFYPTNRSDSRVLCWDWDTGYCGAVHAYSSLGEIQDYGFYSEGNCVFGLGHNAFWWAFGASTFDGGNAPECTGSSATQKIRPCPCAGDLNWGVMNFDISENEFASFLLVIRDDQGTQVFPPLSDDPNEPPTPPHNVLSEDGDVIDLNFLPVLDALQELTVFVTVEPIPGVNPWRDGATQSFAIELERTPRLTD